MVHSETQTLQAEVVFVLGGARSGKSAYAEQWARAQAKRVLFIATAQALDDEMRERIVQHRAIFRARLRPWNARRS